MGFYYLHSEKKDLIWKKYRIDPTESDFVVKVWELDTSKRENAWTIILEGFALGVPQHRIEDLCRKWNCDLDDFKFLVRRVGKPTPLMQEGARLFLEKIAVVDVDGFLDWLEPFPT